MHSPPRVAPLTSAHRERVADILRATAVFRDEEITVALELFDETYGTERAASGERSGPTGPCHPEPDYHFLGAFDTDDRLLGYACHGPTPATDRTHDLYWIAVDPRAQGTGAGTRLMAEIERRLAAGAGRLLVVETSGREAYAATRAFYRARGYTEAARVRDFYAPGDDRIVFTKRLSNHGASLIHSTTAGHDGSRPDQRRATIHHGPTTSGLDAPRPNEAEPQR